MGLSAERRNSVQRMIAACPGIQAVTNRLKWIQRQQYSTTWLKRIWGSCGPTSLCYAEGAAPLALRDCTSVLSPGKTKGRAQSCFFPGDFRAVSRKGTSLEQKGDIPQNRRVCNTAVLQSPIKDGCGLCRVECLCLSTGTGTIQASDSAHHNVC